MASKRERSPGIWELRCYDPSTRSGQRSRTFRGGPQAADRALARFQTEVEDARQAAPAAGSFADLLERWLVHCKPNVERSTWASYRQIATRVSDDLGDLQLAEVTVKRLDAYYRELLAENVGTKDKPRHRSANTVGHYHAVIRRSLGQAARWGEIGSNPAKLTDPPVVRRPDLSIPEADVAAELVRSMASKNPEFARFLFLLLATGVRRGESVALRWADVDLDAATMRVHRAIVVVAGELVEKDTKTHQARVVDLDDATVEVLRHHRTKMEARAHAAGVRMAARAFVFSDSATCGRSWHPDMATRRWSRHATAAGYPGVRIHDLRHTMATAWLDAGVPVHVVSQRLGHAKTSTTSDVYGHVSDGSQKRAAALMATGLPQLEGPTKGAE